MIQIELRPEIEAQLAAEAHAKGVEIPAYVATLIEQAVSSRSDRRPTNEEMSTFFQAMAANSEKIPQLQDEAFERASFYQDHD